MPSSVISGAVADTGRGARHSRIADLHGRGVFHSGSGHDYRQTSETRYSLQEQERRRLGKS